MPQSLIVVKFKKMEREKISAFYINISFFHKRIKVKKCIILEKNSQN